MSQRIELNRRPFLRTAGMTALAGAVGTNTSDSGRRPRALPRSRPTASTILTRFTTAPARIVPNGIVKSKSTAKKISKWRWVWPTWISVWRLVSLER